MDLRVDVVRLFLPFRLPHLRASFLERPAHVRLCEAFRSICPDVTKPGALNAGALKGTAQALERRICATRSALLQTAAIEALPSRLACLLDPGKRGKKAVSGRRGASLTPGNRVSYI